MAICVAKMNFDENLYSFCILLRADENEIA